MFILTKVICKRCWNTHFQKPVQVYTFSTNFPFIHPHTNFPHDDLNKKKDKKSPWFLYKQSQSRSHRMRNINHRVDERFVRRRRRSTYTSTWRWWVFILVSLISHIWWVCVCGCVCVHAVWSIPFELLSTYLVEFE